LELIQIVELAGVGLVAGTWGSMIGAGGGFIIVPILLLIDDTISPAVVTAVSLVAVLVNSLSGTLVNASSKRIDYKTGVRFLTATLPGSILGAFLVNLIERGLFQVVLGTLLCALSIYLIAKPSRLLIDGQPRHTGAPSCITDAGGRVFKYNVNRLLGTGMTFIVGFLASLLGVGGGIFNVPGFVLLLGIPIEIATATSHFMVMGTATIANGTNIIQGDLQGQWPLALALSAGTLLGGQLGPRISYRFGSRWLNVALSIGLLVVGLRLIWGGWNYYSGL
jgi:uncharacterized membrane protein YfcA